MKKRQQVLYTNGTNYSVMGCYTGDGGPAHVTVLENSIKYWDTRTTNSGIPRTWGPHYGEVIWAFNRETGELKLNRKYYSKEEPSLHNAEDFEPHFLIGEKGINLGSIVKETDIKYELHDEIDNVRSICYLTPEQEKCYTRLINSTST
ncbi:MAG TPA: hypothetical protein VJB94_01825 [Candidatus Nanoarchaeia archaeon]|nr:hypothetical protein [Candidatus Nanoarchaeia archaeon]